MNEIAEINPRAVIGDNAPPDPRATTKARVDELVSGANVWANALKDISDATTAAACQDFINQVKAEAEAVEAKRVAEAKPHREALQEIQDWYKPVGALLEGCDKILKRLKGTWLAHEEARLKREAAEREAEALRLIAEADAAKKAAEAGTGDAVQNAVAAELLTKEADKAVRVADAAFTAKPRVSGAMGGRASGFRTVWEGEITDYDAALAHYKSRDSIRAEVQRLANADATAMKEACNIPGIKAKSDRKVM
jgi:hypothetical protein